MFRLLAVGPAIAASAGALAAPVVQVERNGEVYKVNVQLFVPSERLIVWRVLTDYENLFRFVPGLRSSRIVSPPGEPMLLEQKGESALLFVKVATETVSRIKEVPMQTIQFELVGGTLRSMRGEWSIDAHDHAISVSYHAEIVPGFALPPLIGSAVMSRNVKAMVEGVTREINRRTVLKTGQDTKDPQAPAAQ